MTCIIGYIDRKGKAIYMGSDSAGTSGSTIRIHKDPKVFIRDPFIIGFTSSFRMGQLLMSDERFNIRIQKEKESDYDYMISAFIPAIQKLFETGGFLTKKNDEFFGGVFLVGYKDNLYYVDSDFQIAEFYEDHAACGCGENYALGSLYSTRKEKTEDQIREALECAEHYSSGVRGPFNIIKKEF